MWMSVFLNTLLVGPSSTDANNNQTMPVWCAVTPALFRYTQHQSALACTLQAPLAAGYYNLDVKVTVHEDVASTTAFQRDDYDYGAAYNVRHNHQKTLVRSTLTAIRAIRACIAFSASLIRESSLRLIGWL
jgi:hypothetical protein